MPLANLSGSKLKLMTDQGLLVSNNTLSDNICYCEAMETLTINDNEISKTVTDLLSMRTSLRMSMVIQIDMSMQSWKLSGSPA